MIDIMSKTRRGRSLSIHLDSWLRHVGENSLIRCQCRACLTPVRWSYVGTKSIIKRDLNFLLRAHGIVYSDWNDDELKLDSVHCETYIRYEQIPCLYTLLVNISSAFGYRTTTTGECNDPGVAPLWIRDSICTIADID